MTTLSATLENSTKLAFSLPLATAKQIASLITFADSGRNATPTLSRIRVEIDGNKLTAMATDRYALVVLNLIMIETGSDNGAIYIDHDSAKFISSLKATGTDGFVYFDLDGEDLTIGNRTGSMIAKQLKANYPPVNSLIENSIDASEVQPISLNVNLVARLGKLIDLDGKKIDLWAQRPQLSGTGSTKPGPVLFTPTKSSSDLVVMIQPTYLTR